MTAGRRWVRRSLAVIVALLLAVASYVTSALLAFALTPTCQTTEPPGPLKLDLALGVTAIVAGAIPVLAAGKDMRGWRWVLGGIAAAPPVLALGFALTRSMSGFCF